MGRSPGRRDISFLEHLVFTMYQKGKQRWGNSCYWAQRQKYRYEFGIHDAVISQGHHNQQWCLLYQPFFPTHMYILMFSRDEVLIELVLAKHEVHALKLVYITALYLFFSLARPIPPSIITGSTAAYHNETKKFLVWCETNFSRSLGKTAFYGFSSFISSV